MGRFDGILKWHLLSPALWLVVVVLQIAVLIRFKSPPHPSSFGSRNVLSQTDRPEAQPDNRVSPLVTEAESAFQGGKDQFGIALLTAALNNDPDNGRAIEVYQTRLRQRFEKALDDQDWESAELQVAAYDATIHGAFRGAATKEDVQALVERQEQVARWEQQLSDERECFLRQEIAAITQQTAAADETTISNLDARLRQLPTQGLDDELVGELAALALHIERRHQIARLDSLKAQLAKLTAASANPKTGMSELRELRIQSEQLSAQIVEARVQGAEDIKLQAACQDLLTQLDQRLQVSALRQMQTIADADAKNAIDEARRKLDVLQQKNKSESRQHFGETLAAAERLLLRIDRLCSTGIQDEAHGLLECIRAQVVILRTEQLREYNLWAIGVLEESIADYKKAKGILDDDEQAFMTALREKIGRIDPQHLHPVTHSLFAEMFQKLLSELDPDQKIAATRAVESAERRPLSDF